MEDEKGGGGGGGKGGGGKGVTQQINISPNLA